MIEGSGSGSRAPDPYLWLVDPDPGGPKTCGSGGSGSGGSGSGFWSGSATLEERIWKVAADGFFIIPTRRGLNDLWSTKLSCGRKIGFRAPPPSPPPQHQVVSLSPSSCVSPVELTDGIGGEGAWSQIIRPPECLALCKSTTCYDLSTF